MLSFIAFVVLVTGANAAVVPSLNMPRLNNTQHFSAPTARKASRIINGEAAGIQDFPHQLTLLYNGYHICGASLLSNEWAITAAHCVEGAQARLLAVAGGFLDFRNPAGHFFIQIDRFIMHENYDQGPGAFPNDIALLKLSPHTYDLSDFTIGLASGSYKFTGDLCFISGWGVTESDTGGSDILMKSEVEVLSNTDCDKEWDSLSYIQPQHICVWGMLGDRSGSCNGDSGGPLTCNGVLAGLTSWGRTGCHSNGVVEYPSVYVRITHFYDWILQNCNNCV